jgi:ApaG protein
MIYHEETDGFKVLVEPSFLGSEVSQEIRYYIFKYRVTIVNNTALPARLISRHWIIRNGFGGEEQVNGDGVVGEKPWIMPGNSYTYESGCPLPCPTGNMRGSYRLVTESGKQFQIKIPLFFLRSELIQKELYAVN